MNGASNSFLRQISSYSFLNFSSRFSLRIWRALFIFAALTRFYRYLPVYFIKQDQNLYNMVSEFNFSVFLDFNLTHHHYYIFRSVDVCAYLLIYNVNAAFNAGFLAKELLRLRNNSVHLRKTY